MAVRLNGFVNNLTDGSAFAISVAACSLYPDINTTHNPRCSDCNRTASSCPVIPGITMSVTSN